MNWSLKSEGLHAKINHINVLLRESLNFIFILFLRITIRFFFAYFLAFTSATVQIQV